MRFSPQDVCVALLKFPGDLPGVVMRQDFSLFFPRGAGPTNPVQSKSLWIVLGLSVISNQQILKAVGTTREKCYLWYLQIT